MSRAEHPISWGAAARLTLDIVVTSSFYKKVIHAVIRGKKPKTTGFVALWG